MRRFDANGGKPVSHPLLRVAGGVVALGAAAATAHGLFEVAVASRVPGQIAWLYPVITDGLALVAYGATASLARGAGRTYAWAVVVLAAGLSGLAQAAFLAGDAALTAPAPLRFGVGAWPAVAAALVAHLIYLIVRDEPVDADVQDDRDEEPVVQATAGLATDLAPAVEPTPTAGAEHHLLAPAPVSEPAPAPAAPREPAIDRRPRVGRTSDEDLLQTARTWAVDEGRPVESRNEFRRITGCGGDRADRLWAVLQAEQQQGTTLRAVPGGAR
jgi:hypothetical protein